MCNLYSQTSNQEAIRRLFRFDRDLTGNMPALPGIFPDYLAPIVRNAPDGQRELMMGRWGMPCPPAFGGRPVTNIRNVKSPHWRRWLGPANRCLVLATSFSEYHDVNGKKVPTWFALDPSRPLFAFAGIWATWHGTRGTKANPAEGEHTLYGFLTCNPNAVVEPVHPKAMPVILRTADEAERWLTAPAEQVTAMQCPLPDDALQIIATGAREDPPPAAVPDLLGAL